MTSLCIWLGLLITADETAAQQRLQQLHLAEAKRWRMYLDAERKTQAALVSKPVYLWTNPIRSGGQNGAVYVWTWQGRAVRNEQNQFQYNADHTYRLFFDKEIDELPELAAENR
jgi:hypothetical protein